MALNSSIPEDRDPHHPWSQVTDPSGAQPTPFAGPPTSVAGGLGNEVSGPTGALSSSLPALQLDTDIPSHSLRRGDRLRPHPCDPSQVIVARVEALHSLPKEVQVLVSQLASRGAPAAAPSPPQEPPLRLLP